MDKRRLGWLGETELAKILIHKFDWGIAKPHVDEGCDLNIYKLWCKNCGKYTQQEQRKKVNVKGEKAGAQFPTDKCANCFEQSTIWITRFLQVKTSAGVKNKRKDESRKFSFHTNLRYHIDPRSFYVWIALFEQDPILYHYYIFSHNEIDKNNGGFDDLSLRSYQETDNQKLSFDICESGKILNKGTKYDYSCFVNFHNNFHKLDAILNADGTGIPWK